MVNINTDKVRFAWVIAAQRAIIDSQTQLVSLQDLLDTLDVEFHPDKESQIKPKKITVNTDFYVVTYWIYDNDQPIGKILDFKVSLISSEKEVMFEVPMHVVHEKSSNKYRHLLKVNGLGVTVSGLYAIQVDLKTDYGYEKVGQYEFDVKVKETPPVS